MHARVALRVELHVKQYGPLSTVGLSVVAVAVPA